MKLNTQSPNLDSLFEAKFIGNVVIVSMTGSSNQQAEALANMLHRTRALGEFRQTQNLDGSDIQLTFFKTTLVHVNWLLTTVSIEKLSSEIAMIERAAAQYAAASLESEKINNLQPQEFGQFLGSRSAGKLILPDNLDRSKLILKTSILIPITHFKTLAKLTKYDGKTRTFTVRSIDLSASTRDQLLQLADKLAKSTKKVSPEDIAARRARRGAQYAHFNNAELERLIEGHMYDVFGYDSVENRKLSRAAFSK